VNTDNQAKRLGDVPAWIARLTGTLLLMLTTSGCYWTQYQVFGREDSVLVSGLEGRYEAKAENGNVIHYTVSRAHERGSYRFRGDDLTKGDTAPDDFAKSGTFRAIPISQDIYIMQWAWRPDDYAETGHHTFMYLFFRVVRSGDAVIKIERLESSADKDQVEKLVVAGHTIARRNGVDQWTGDGSVGISGAPAALKRFLLDMGDVAAASFKVESIFTRIP
jgi:hypothetical protein